MLSHLEFEPVMVKPFKLKLIVAFGTCRTVSCDQIPSDTFKRSVLENKNLNYLVHIKCEIRVLNEFSLPLDL